MAGIFSEVFGKKDKSVPVDDLINRIDTAIDNLGMNTKPNSDNENELVTKSITDLMVPDNADNNSLSSGSDGDNFVSNLDPIFKDLAVPEERLAKYKVYDTIYGNVQIIKKIVSVYLDNIFQKDAISSKVLLIKEVDKDKSSGNIDEYKKFASRFIEFFNLDERLRTLVFKSLKYGDAYIEYINLDDVKDNFPKVKEQEAKALSGMAEEVPAHYNSTVVTESQMDVIKKRIDSAPTGKKDKVILDTLEVDRLSNAVFEFGDNIAVGSDSDNVIFKYIKESDPAATAIDKIKEKASKTKRNVTEKGNAKKADPKKGSNLSGIVLRYHDPHKIIPIVSEYDNILGYVELKTIDKKGTETYNPVLGFMDIVKKVSNMRGNSNNNKYEKIIQMFATTISKKVLAKYKVFYDPTKENMGNKKQLEEQYQKQVKSVLNDELYYSLKRILLDTNINNLFYKKLQVRFISVDSMYKFPISTSSTYPFGESIIDPLIYPGKLYLLTQLSNMVTKLSRSSIIRKWTVDVGSRENESDILNRLKKQIRNQKITASDLTSSKEIPRLLSDFRDFVTFTKKGQRFVDVETLQHGDPNIGIRDLEDQRKDLVALSGVPAAFLGYQDHYELREQLIHTNIQFATTISSIQHTTNDSLNKLMDKVSLDVGFENPMSDYVRVSLVPPVSLILQLVESTINSVSNIQRVFMEMPVLKEADPTYLLRRYVPYIDWDDYLREAKAFKLKKDVLKDKQAMDPNAGMGGGFGGGGF